MHTLFPGYYKLKEDDFKRMWKEGGIFLDANFVLNFYRYPEATREDILRILSQVKSRIFITHYACLEYQRNRVEVILEQRDRFEDVRDCVKSVSSDAEKKLSELQLEKRHAKIRPDSFLAKIRKLSDEFLAELTELEKTTIDHYTNDDLRVRVEELFDGRIGLPPQNQDQLDKIYKEGAVRYDKRIPPGYKDAKKARSEEAEFSYGGLVYQRQFGDLLVWKQLIGMAKEKGFKDVVFLTDDDKEDWWLIVSSRKVKKVGPRPELIEEIFREAGVERFHIYNSEQFAKFAKETLKANIKDATVKSIASFSAAGSLIVGERSGRDSFVERQFLSIASVISWLRGIGMTVSETASRQYPDIRAVASNKEKIGCEVISLRNTFNVLRVFDDVYKGGFLVQSGEFDEFWLIITVERAEIMDRTLNLLKRSPNPLPPKTTIFVGTNEHGAFRPAHAVGFSDGYALL